jgi:hypothetical protein
VGNYSVSIFRPVLKEGSEEVNALAKGLRSQLARPGTGAVQSAAFSPRIAR